MNIKQKQSGFTLVELLVVIAIIGILASIVLPKVTDAIYRGQVARAVSEVKNIDTSLTAMLSDVERSDFNNWLVIEEDPTEYGNSLYYYLYDPDDGLVTIFEDNLKDDTYSASLMFAEAKEITDIYTGIMYSLLRQGKNAETTLPIGAPYSDFSAADDLKPEIRQKLGNSYMDLGLDSWGQKYQFWIGPRRGKFQIFRSYRKDEDKRELDDPLFDITDVYKYDINAQTAEDLRIPGAPRQDYEGLEGSLEVVGDGDPDFALYGFPASKDMPMYVFSKGLNQLPDGNAILQMDYSAGDHPMYGGGDDINNWDNEAGWKTAPR